jgi:sirohydrochlorin ferrochelatase
MTHEPNISLSSLMSVDRKPTPSEKSRMTAEPQAHCPMVLQMERESASEANKNDGLEMSAAAAVTLNSSSSPIGFAEDDATLDVRKRNAVYSKRKYYKKKMEVERLEMSKSELGATNQRLRTENQILELALQEAQAKVLAIESLKGVAGGTLLRPQQTQNQPLRSQQLSPSPFGTSNLAVSTLPLPSNTSHLSTELAAAGGAIGNGTTTSISRDLSWQYNPAGLMMNSERINTLSLDERIRIAQARLQATQEEERQLLQLLSRMGGIIPPQLQQHPSLFQNLTQQPLTPWSPRLPVDYPVLEAELQRRFLQGQSLQYQQPQPQRQLDQQTLDLMEQHQHQQQLLSEPLNLKSVGDANSTDSTTSVAI